MTSFKSFTSTNVETTLDQNVRTLKEALKDKLPLEGTAQLKTDFEANFGRFFNLENKGIGSAYSNVLGDPVPLANLGLFSQETDDINVRELLVFQDTFPDLFNQDLNGAPLFRADGLDPALPNLGTALTPAVTSVWQPTELRIADTEQYKLYDDRGLNINKVFYEISNPQTYYNQNLYRNTLAEEMPDLGLGFTFGCWSGMRAQEYSADPFENSLKYAYLTKVQSWTIQFDASNWFSMTYVGANLSIRARIDGQGYAGVVAFDDYFPTDPYYNRLEDGKPPYYVGGNFVSRNADRSFLQVPYPRGFNDGTFTAGRFVVSYDPAVTSPNGLVVRIQTNEVASQMLLRPISITTAGVNGLVGLQCRGRLNVNLGAAQNQSIQINDLAGPVFFYARPLTIFELAGAYINGY